MKINQRSNSKKLHEASLFNYMPQRTLDSLSEQQRSDIAFTIFKLVQSNPHVLHELYFNNRDSKSSSGEVIKDFRRGIRIYLFFRRFWLSLAYRPSGTKAPLKISDFIFSASMLFTLSFFVTAIFIGIYVIKSAVGIDIFPGFHLFCTD